jgi:arylsulfatase A-like enzyme
MASRDPDRPNVLFILTDDQGCWALGCAGNPEIRTPNLDSLAASGIRFENFFCTSPVCSPSRASFLTGRIPSQHGVHDWIRRGNDTDGIEYLAGLTGYSDLLAAAGYTCGISGKWHLGDSLRPQKGFSHWYVYPTGGGVYLNGRMIRDGAYVDVPGYVTDDITDDALGFIASTCGDDAPFYHSLHYTAPHSPWIDQHPQDIVDSYNDCPFDTCPQEPLHPGMGFYDFQLSKFLAGRKGEAIPTREYLKGYFAAVTAMDANVGRVLQRLDDLGLRENTLIFFSSDNGFNCGHHGIWGKGSATFPLNMYDTSVKVPAIVSQPGRIPQGIVCDALLSAYDFMPTLLDYLGLENPEADRLPGRSFAMLLSGESDDGDEHVVVYDEYGPVRMVRTREWKYVHRYPYGPHELYDLVNDPGERINLLADDRGFGASDAEVAARVADLKGRLENWFVRYVDPALDGTHEPVTGRGQIHLAGPAGGGASAFCPRVQVEY